MAKSGSLARQLTAGSYHSRFRGVFDAALDLLSVDEQLIALLDQKFEEDGSLHTKVQSLLFVRSRDAFRTALLAVSSGSCSDALVLFRVVFDLLMDMELLRKDPQKYTKAFSEFECLSRRQMLRTAKEWARNHSCKNTFLSGLAEGESHLESECQQVIAWRQEHLKSKVTSHWSGLKPLERLAAISDPTSEEALFSIFAFAYRLGSQFAHGSPMGAGKYLRGSVPGQLSLQAYETESDLSTVLKISVEAHLKQSALVDSLLNRPLADRLAEVNGRFQKAAEPLADSREE